MPSSSRIVYYGNVIQSRTLLELDAWTNALIGVDPSGIIAWVESGPVPSSSVQDIAAKHGWDITDPSSDIQVIEGRGGEWLMPGLVDTHSHASQFPNLGTGQQYQLLDWLKNVTFPTESRFKDVEYARKAYEQVVTRVLNNGTTTCCYYATLHLDASKVLADIAFAKGQRAFIGKCNMDSNSPPDYIEPSASASIAATQNLIKYIQGLELPSDANSIPLVQPILTPRFAISCSHELLTGIGELYNSPAATSSAPYPPLLLQTHISENQGEIEATKELFAHLPTPTYHSASASSTHPHTNNHIHIPSHPATHTYTSIYDHYALLTPRTILAHGVHLTPPELDLLHARGVGLSHCAGSNFNLRSGVASVGDWLERGLKVGLGTDVSGGFNSSIVSEVRQASVASKVRAMMDAHAHAPVNSDPSENHFTKEKEKESPFTSAQGLPVPTLLHMATLGGAALCNLSSHIGSFAPGKQFDALYVSLREGGVPGVWYEAEREPEESLEVQLERFLFCGDDRNVRKVWVRGRLVGGAEF